MIAAALLAAAAGTGAAIVTGLVTVVTLIAGNL